MRFAPWGRGSQRNQSSFDHYGFVDNAKAIGIVLVVLGHSRGLPDSLIRLIFSFHVPLFFFISGFLVKPNKLGADVCSNAKKILQTLGIPYLLFFSLAFVYWLATRHMGAKALLYAGKTWYGPIVGLFSGLESDLYVDPPLWFFPCFILTAITYQASRKFLTLKASTCLYAVLAFFLSVLWKYDSYRLPLGLDSMWIALSFYAVGQYVREKNVFSNIRSFYIVAILLISSALLIYASSFNDRVDLANMYFGIRPALYLPTALLGIIAVFSISQLLPSSRLSRWLSENTLTIFPAHFIFLSLIRGGAMSLHMLPNNYQYGIGWSVVSSAMAILLCVPFAYLLRRLPILRKPVLSNNA